VTSVGFFADRVGRGLARDAHQLLGADLVLVSDHAFAGNLAADIEKRNLRSASAVAFMSMAIVEGKSQLAGVKAVTENYPLRGQLRIAAALGAPDAPVAAGPPRGKVWIEERLVSALGAPVGTRLRLGDAELEVGAVLTLEPERSANFFNFAPRLMMNAADVPASGLIRPGSRASYYLYVAGTAGEVKAAESALKTSLERGQRIETLETGRPEVRASVDRAQRFLALTALLAAILAGVAIALAARRFVQRHLDACAVMRCLGATQSRLVLLYGGEFVAVGIAACALGAAAGFVGQQVLSTALGELLRAELPAPGPLPALQGFLVGLALMLGFLLPPLLQLKNVPAMRVMRRESGRPKGGMLAAYGCGFAALAALLLWQADDLKLGIYVIGGFAAAVAAFVAVSWAMLRLLSHAGVTRRVGNASLRYGLAQLRRHAAGNAVQTTCLALGLTALLLLTFTRDDLVQAWRRSVPPDAPNRFLVGVQPDQRAALEKFFAEQRMATPDFYPMVRGRLTAVNGKPVREQDYEEERNA